MEKKTILLAIGGTLGSIDVWLYYQMQVLTAQLAYWTNVFTSDANLYLSTKASTYLAASVQSSFNAGLYLGQANFVYSLFMPLNIISVGLLVSWLILRVRQRRALLTS
jgi:hypothetical protein